MCDGEGRPVRLHLTAGQVSDFKGADILPDETEEVIGDMIEIKSGSLSQAEILPPVFRRRKTGNQSRLTTGICIKSAI